LKFNNLDVFYGSLITFVVYYGFQWNYVYFRYVYVRAMM